jgi:hypothetical protein
MCTVYIEQLNPLHYIFIFSSFTSTIQTGFGEFDYAVLICIYVTHFDPLHLPISFLPPTPAVPSPQTTPPLHSWLIITITAHIIIILGQMPQMSDNMIFGFLSLYFLTISSFIHFPANDTFHFLWLSNIPLYIYVFFFLLLPIDPLISCWEPCLIPEVWLSWRELQ